MKYNELLNFEPITEVVKFSRTNETDYQKTLIKTFVFSDTIKNHLIPLMIRNLDFNLSVETFGLQVVGNYGTGKSHLMSLISMIAENEDYINLVSDEKPKKDLKAIAGKFKVLRFELGNTESLWEVITFQIETYLKSLGVRFSFDGHGPITYLDKLQLMMAEFEEVFPDKGFLIVVDEMLSYLKGRGTHDKLNQDLSVLQALGQACDKSKFKFIFGVQELIYHSSEFQFASEMLQKVNDRYKDIKINKEDVAFIVKNRLLRKTEHQKQKIKEHLEPFLKFFTDMQARLQDYVELFPVHPSYFENFEKIRIDKSQRAIMTNLSVLFEKIKEQDIPTDNPGVITYEMYWDEIISSMDLMAIPDVRKVKEFTENINDKIETYFVGGRSSKKNIAKRIVSACAIRILQHELNKKNGTNTEHLVDDLCLTDKLADNREFLIDIINSTAQFLITATSGSYFEQNTENGEFRIRIEGGFNYDQNIKDYATNMADQNRDEYFYKFLEINLGLNHDTYRPTFRIWQHTIDWKSHKTYRDGYIFFGKPNEKSTTHPIQHFYMYFMPIFDKDAKARNHGEDEVYFIFDGLSNEFKEVISLYGAAIAQEVRADTSQKSIYKQKISELKDKAQALFNEEYLKITKVDYQGKELPLSGYPLQGVGSSKEQIFSNVASYVFETWFENERPDYPKFTQLKASLAKDNYDRLIKQALIKIANPEQSNSDGEGILSGLGLWIPGMLDYSFSPYAKSLMQKISEKGEGKVLNRDEIIDYIDKSDNLWLSKDFKIEAELEFVVISALTALGEIEIALNSGKTINSTNLFEFRDIQKQDFYSFSHIKPPKGLNLAALKVLFVGMLGRDLSNQLKDNSTFTHLVNAATEWASRSVTVLSKIQGGLIFKGIELISIDEASKYRRDFTAFSGFCDKLANYTSEAKIKNFSFSIDDLNRLLPFKTEIEKVEKLLKVISLLNEDISYLQQCKQYINDIVFKEEINVTINKLSSVLSTNDTVILDNYKKELSKLKERYADWYLKLYLKYRISESDNTLKNALLDSDNKAVCDILKEADFLSSGQYSQWLNKINKLQVADNKVNKNLILTAPYQDFNPIDFEGSESISIEQIKLELKDLVTQWINTLKETLEDPMVKKKIDLLDQSLQKLLEDFKSNKIQLLKDNALRIRNAIMDLHKGLEKVEISFEGMKTTFNKPLTPDEAIDAFRVYIDLIAKGKERDKIRIILK